MSGWPSISDMFPGTRRGGVKPKPSPSRGHLVADLRDRLGTGGFCGCCGNEISEDLLWCNQCMGHLLPDRDDQDHYRCMWDRTWFAQHGTECPVNERRDRKVSDGSL